MNGRMLCLVSLAVAAISDVVWADGSGAAAEIARDWERGRREEVLEWFRDHWFGRAPVGRPADEVIGARSVSCAGGRIRIGIHLSLPEGATREHPVPVFVMGDHCSDLSSGELVKTVYPNIPTNAITGRGYAYVCWNFNDVAPNVMAGPHLDLWSNGVYRVYGGVPRTASSWGTIGAWAWGFSRVMDWIERQPELDSARVAIIGHSRGGKAALWAGAQDTRFSMVISNNSGAGGARLMRLPLAGAETVDDLHRNFPFWFCENYWAYRNNEQALEHDADDLMRLVAPRLLYVASASEDAWAGPSGESAALRKASGLWEAYGCPDRVGYHLRPGHHKLLPEDWSRHLDFADRHLRSSGEFVIAERGKPAACSVVVRHKGSCAEAAAKDLIAYTEKLTGVRLTKDGAAGRRIVLAEGPVELGEDGFEISVKGDVLEIAGGRRGILYGVYDLLERFGDVAWLSSWCEDVPRIGRFAVPAGFRFRDRPRMAVRDFHWADPMRHPEFGARLRLNNACGFGVRKDLGLDALRFTSLGMTHTFDKLLSPTRYFDAHPDWFSEVHGKRLKEKTQICLTNPGALAQCITNVFESFRNTPDANVVAIVPMDYYNYCTCARCKAVDDAEGSQSGTVMGFVNRIAEAVGKEFPGKWVVAEAYEYYRHPPKTVRMRDNVLVGVSAMELDWRDPPRPDGPEGTGENVRDLIGWGKVSKHIYGWDFPVNCSWGLAQQPNDRKIRDWHRVWLENGCFALFSCAGGYHDDFTELKAYLSAHWLWNPDLSADRLTDRFFRGYYGAAAPLVRAYYDERLRLAEKANLRMRVYEPVSTLATAYPDDFYRRARERFRRAEELVRDDPVRLYNVRTSAMPIDYILYRRLYKNIFFSAADRAGAAEGRRAIENLVAAVRLTDEAGHPAGLGMDVKREKLFADAEGKGVCIGDGDRIVLEETAFEKNGYSRSHVDVDDPKAVDGRATRFDYEPQFQNQFTHLSLDRVQFAPGRKCRLKVRLRAEVPVPRGPLFQINVWKGDEQLVGKTFRPEDVTADYAEYVIGEWTPEPGQIVHFWITRYSGEGELAKPTPAKSVWIDNFTLEQF